MTELQATCAREHFEWPNAIRSKAFLFFRSLQLSTMRMVFGSSGRLWESSTSLYLESQNYGNGYSSFCPVKLWIYSLFVSVYPYTALRLSRRGRSYSSVHCGSHGSLHSSCFHMLTATRHPTSPLVRSKVRSKRYEYADR
jgi:hypothetical protein